jgi:hypothetical protein
MKCLRYFEDEAGLDRVPSMFLMMLGVFAGMQLIALLFLREPTSEELIEIKVQCMQCLSARKLCQSA